MPLASGKRQSPLAKLLAATDEPQVAPSGPQRRNKKPGKAFNPFPAPTPEPVVEEGTSWSDYAPLALRMAGGVFGSAPGVGAAFNTAGELGAEALEGRFSPEELLTAAALGAVGGGLAGSVVKNMSTPVKAMTSAAPWAIAHPVVESYMRTGEMPDPGEALTSAAITTGGAGAISGLMKLLGVPSFHDLPKGNVKPKTSFELEQTAGPGFDGKPAIASTLGGGPIAKTLQGSGDDAYKIPSVVPEQGDDLAGVAYPDAGGLSPRASKAIVAAQKAEDARIAKARVDDAMMGLDPQDPTVSQSFSTPIPGGTRRATQRFIDPDAEAAKEAARVEKKAAAKAGRAPKAGAVPAAGALDELIRMFEGSSPTTTPTAQAAGSLDELLGVAERRSADRLPELDEAFRAERAGVDPLGVGQRSPVGVMERRVDRDPAFDEMFQAERQGVNPLGVSHRAAQAEDDIAMQLADEPFVERRAQARTPEDEAYTRAIMQGATPEEAFAARASVGFMRRQAEGITTGGSFGTRPATAESIALREGPQAEMVIPGAVLSAEDLGSPEAIQQYSRYLRGELPEAVSDNSDVAARIATAEGNIRNSPDTAEADAILGGLDAKFGNVGTEPVNITPQSTATSELARLFKSPGQAAGEHYRELKGLTTGDFPSKEVQRTATNKVAGQAASRLAKAEGLPPGPPAGMAQPPVEMGAAPLLPQATPSFGANASEDLKKFFMGQGIRPGQASRGVKGFGGEEGFMDPSLAASLGLGVAGALGGAALDPLDNELMSAMIGGAAGAALPQLAAKISSIAPAVMQSPGVDEANAGLIQQLSSKEGVGSAMMDIVRTLPAVQRGMLLSNPNIFNNAIVAPYSAAISFGLERAMAGDPRGWAVLREMQPGNFSRNFYNSWDEASKLIGDAERAGGPMTGAAGNKIEYTAALPGTFMASGDLTARKAIMAAGFTEAEARMATLTSEPETKFGRGLVNLQRAGGPLAQMALPFARTIVNLGEQGVRRTPGLGYLAQAMRETPDPIGVQHIQQLLGGGALVGGYAAGEGMDQLEGAMPEIPGLPNDKTSNMRLLRSFLSNAAGPQATLAMMGLAAGQASDAGKAPLQQLGAGMKAGIQEAPLPTTAPGEDIVDFLTAEPGNRRIPRSMAPGFVRDDLNRLLFGTDTNQGGRRKRRTRKTEEREGR